MIELLEKYFSSLVLCAGAVYLTLSIILLHFKVPGTPNYAPYRVAKKLLALTFGVVCINIYFWVFNFHNDWNTPSALVSCVDIILYYLIGILFSYSFSILLDRKYLNKRRYLIDFGKWAACSVIAIIAITDAMQPYSQWILLISLGFLLEFFLGFFFHFRKTYARSGELLDNYFASDKRHFINWIKRSIILIYILGLLAILTINMGAIMNWLFQVYIISLNIYITISFINYASEYGNLQQADEEITERDVEHEEDSVHPITTEQETLNKKQIENIEELLKPRVMAWIGTKKYINEQFNIEDLAKLLGTNKYYLSRFIKENYQMNFSTWIASLRIEEAKKMMTDDPKIKLEEVALSVGFSSLSYFSKVFSRLEGTTPSLWLRANSR